MTDPKQPTQPKGTDEHGKPHPPIEIPVPKEGDVLAFLEKAATTPDPDSDSGSAQ